MGEDNCEQEPDKVVMQEDRENMVDVMMSCGDLGTFLSGFSLISLVLYFVTSSDSGSLVIDC